MATYDLIGSIAILKFPEKTSLKKKKKYASEFLSGHRSIKTVLEKAEKVKGRLRISKTKFLAGENKRETVYIENGCRFRFNVDETYFSPRLAGERLRIADEIASKSGKKTKILVMFAGVAPFSIVIGRVLKKLGKKAEIVSNEINRKASKYAEENVRLNKLNYYIKVIQGDAKNLHRKVKEKFDFIVMPRPQLKETFLSSAFKFCKKNTEIYYYDFGKDAEEILKKVEIEARKARKKIKILDFRKAGEIAPYRYRWLVRFKVN